MSLWTRLTELAGQTRTEARETDALAPDRSFIAIGDIHGCFDLLEPLLASARHGEMIVTVGDYIDRGPDSAKVLARLHALNLSGRVICLMGNHERMMLDFLDHPAENGTHWLTNGGMQTLWSLGLDLPQGSAEQALIQTASALSERLGPIEDWLRHLPLIWTSGNVAVVHAATNPTQPLNRQDEHTLLWGRPKPETPARPDGIWVVHGHTIVPDVQIGNGRFNIDTGAFRSRRLTALRIEKGGYQILS